jgi:protein-S-isoprenylcysteine O-methyltransferase Ste14
MFMAQEITLRWAFWLLMALVLVMRVYFAYQVKRAGERYLPDKAAVEREGKGSFAVRFVGFFALLGFLVLYGIHPAWMRRIEFALPLWLRWAGFVLGLVSLAFWTWVQIELGKQWSAQLQLREEHHLVTSGPYARIRHPMYTAMLGWAVSLALVTANWVFVFMVALTAVMMVSRTPKEEQMMIEQFGDEYREYMRRTGRFLPR